LKQDGQSTRHLLGTTTFQASSIIDAIEAYEQRRWPLGKVPGGKG
jgi:hypothetical protein